MSSPPETDGSKSRHCTRCDEKDRCHGDSAGHDSNWTCSIDVTVEAPKCGTVVEKRKTWPRGRPGGHNAGGCLLAAAQPAPESDACWCTVDGKTFTGISSAARPTAPNSTWRAKAGLLCPRRGGYQDHLTIHGGALGSLKRYTKKYRSLTSSVTAVHDYDGKRHSRSRLRCGRPRAQLRGGLAPRTRAVTGTPARRTAARLRDFLLTAGAIIYSFRRRHPYWGEKMDTCETCGCNVAPSLRPA